MAGRGLCAVTGAGGYVGSRLAAALAADGWRIRELTRGSVPRLSGADHARFTLTEPPDASSLAGVDALVHCAWDFAARSGVDVERVNVEGSRRLLGVAGSAGIQRILFVSTLSAFPGCRSLYGRAKLAVEEATLAAGGAVVRLGLVWGPGGGSLFANLRRLASTAPLLPVFTDRRLHLLHEDDLGSAVAAILARERSHGTTYVAAAEEALPLAEILRRLARVRGRTLRTVRVPWWAVWAPLRTLELIGLRPHFRSDSVVSLVSLDEDPFVHGLVPAVVFRPFDPRLAF